MNRRPGRLTVVGTGIKTGWHTTAEARHCLERADHVMFVVNDVVTTAWMRRINPSTESLTDAYREGRSRHEAYREMADRIMARLREGGHVCAAFYGHPGVFVRPSREALRRAHEEGFPARMLPGVSAEDCLYADLGIEPAATGIQRFEATDFLLYPRSFDPSSALILWQVGTIGRIDYRESAQYGRVGLRVLTDHLGHWYGPHHPVILYEAAALPVDEPRIDRLRLSELAQAEVTPRSTLYVPPLPSRPPDPERVRRLGLAGRLGGIDVKTLRRATGLDPFD